MLLSHFLNFISLRNPKIWTPPPNKGVTLYFVPSLPQHDRSCLTPSLWRQLLRAHPNFKVQTQDNKIILHPPQKIYELPFTPTLKYQFKNFILMTFFFIASAERELFSGNAAKITSNTGRQKLPPL